MFHLVHTPVDRFEIKAFTKSIVFILQQEVSLPINIDIKNFYQRQASWKMETYILIEGCSSKVPINNHGQYTKRHNENIKYVEFMYLQSRKVRWAEMCLAQPKLLVKAFWSSTRVAKCECDIYIYLAHYYTSGEIYRGFLDFDS
jgi:hypothetical protein